jgi:hypothetical protein
MILFEGRSADVYNKFKEVIDNERKLISSYMSDASTYDFIATEPFIKNTNFKYLNDLITLFYNNLIQEYKLTGKDVEPLERDEARNYLFSIRRRVEEVLNLLSFYDKHKSKFKYPEFRQYFKNFDSFVGEASKLKKEVETKQQQVAARKEVDKIFDNDTLLIVKPKSHTSSCYYGAGTMWCTTMAGNPSYFNQYSSNGSLYYIILKNVDRSNKFYKMAIHTDKSSKFGDKSVWYDSHDNRLTDREKEAVLAHMPRQAYNLMANDHAEMFKTRPVIDELYDVLRKNEIGYGADNEKFGKKEITFIYKDFWITENKDNSLSLQGEFNVLLPKSNDEGYTKYNDQDYIILLNIKPNVTIQSNQTLIEYVDVRGEVQPANLTDNSISKGYKFILPQVPINLSSPELILQSLRKIVTAVKQNILSNFNMSIVNDSEMREWFGYPTRSYTMAKYTFTGKGKVTKAFMDYLNAIPEGKTGSKEEFLTKIGRENRPGYLSNFFSGVNQAGISKRVGRSGLVKGPNFDKFYSKIKERFNEE